MFRSHQFFRRISDVLQEKRGFREGAIGKGQGRTKAVLGGSHDRLEGRRDGQVGDGALSATQRATELALQAVGDGHDIRHGPEANTLNEGHLALKEGEHFGDLGEAGDAGGIPGGVGGGVDDAIDEKVAEAVLTDSGIALSRLR